MASQISKKSLYRQQRGASLTGYGLIVGLIAVLAIAAVQGVGENVSALFGAVGLQMETAATGGQSGSGSGNGAGSCAANSAGENWTHAALDGGDTTSGTRSPGEGTAPDNATSFDETATISCASGEASASDILSVATACQAGYTLEEGACTAPDYLALTIGETNNDVSNALISDGAGGYFATGYTDSSGQGSRDLFIMRLTAEGNPLWARTLGSANDERGHSVTLDGAGGVIVAGLTFPDGSATRSMLIARFSGSGDMDWVRTLAIGGSSGSGGSNVGNVIADGDGNVLVTGQTTFGTTWLGLFLAKIEIATGNLVWMRLIDANLGDIGGFVAPDGSGTGYIYLGTLDRLSGGQTKYVGIMRLDLTGNLIWSRTLNGQSTSTSRHQAEGVIPDGAGGFLVVGRTNDTVVGAGGWDGFIARFDASNGDIDWVQVIGGSSDDHLFDVISDGAGGFVALGQTQSAGNGDNDIFIVPFASNGTINVSAIRTLGGSGSDTGSDLLREGSNFTLLGRTQSWGQGNWDVMFARLDSNFEIPGLAIENSWSPTITAPTLTGGSPQWSQPSRSISQPNWGGSSSTSNPGWTAQPWTPTVADIVIP